MLFVLLVCTGVNAFVHFRGRLFGSRVSPPSLMSTLVFLGCCFVCHVFVCLVMCRCVGGWGNTLGVFGIVVMRIGGLALDWTRVGRGGCIG